MKRDAALAVLGAWVMGTIFMVFVAAENFYLVDRLINLRPSAGFSNIVDSVGAVPIREFMRYQASELNRLFFVAWGATQVLLGSALVWLTWRWGSRRIRVASAVMLLLAAVLAAGLTPPILSVGRALDFVPRDPQPAELATFGLLHAAYTIADLGKLSLALILGFWVQRLDS